MPVDLPERAPRTGAVQYFDHQGFKIAFLDAKPDSGPDSGKDEPILLVHGFASSMMVNWVTPGWVKSLTEAGYRTIAFDHRGHGQTSKSYEASDYTPEKMAGDAAALLRHLGIERAHVFGYSMGARVSAFLALAEPAMAATLVFGGLGIGLVEGVGDWDPIADALLVADAETITHPRGKTFRAFADQTKSDRRALAACIVGSRAELTESEVQRIAQPTLIGIGTRDDIAGSAEDLAGLMPNAVAFAIEGRDHMLSVGDRTWKKRVLEFLTQHKL